ncbi:energy transducer TonB [Algoriphagus sp. D3-2-R+10]|uniref:energy transducer TonB n=1 Tax=Algoriphagus aurantiacus TaxID=3103948 RepID=UPI002B3B8F17|nr:energy transducer TonB [Algoriphagus sp. D3-2-R+10]MEB2776427.1 energy transducer TonB [Algoriphagus sp. D3-2-R+10]
MKPVLNENFGTHKYNQILTTGKDSSSISKIYDLKNRLIRQTKEKYNEELGYNEAIISRYDTLQNLISSELKNVDNGSFVRVFLDKETVVSRLQFTKGDSNGEYFKFYMGDSETPIATGSTNPMDPSPSFEQDEFFKFLSQILEYPNQARAERETGTAIVAIEVNKNGEVIDYQCVNKDLIHPSFAKEAIRVIKKFDPKFNPAYGIFGEPVAGTFKIPIRFKLS